MPGPELKVLRPVIIATDTVRHLLTAGSRTRVHTRTGRARRPLHWAEPAAGCPGRLSCVGHLCCASSACRVCLQHRFTEGVSGQNPSRFVD